MDPIEFTWAGILCARRIPRNPATKSAASFSMR